MYIHVRTYRGNIQLVYLQPPSTLTDRVEYLGIPYDLMWSV